MKLTFSKKGKGLKIIIVGCGKVGTTLVERLRQENHEITVVDQNPEVVQRVAGTYDVMGVTGNGASYNVQLEAGIQDTDLIVAVTDSDELNLLCCTIAKKFRGCAAVARVRNPDYSNELGYLRNQLGISLIINPELETAKEISRLLRMPTALEIHSFAKGQVEMVKFKVQPHSMLHEKSIMDVTKDFSGEMLFCGIERESELIIPDGSFVLREGDSVTFIATPINTHKFFRYIGMDTQHAKSCMIIGGGKTSFYLAKLLSDLNIDVKIIEMNQKRCEELSAYLPKALIIYGDGGDEELLVEEGIEKVDAFVPLTGIDEENILLTLFAKKYKNAKLITKINRSTFNNIIDGLDMGSLIYPRYMTTESIIKYVRGMENSVSSNIETLYHIFDNRAEAIEFEVDPNSKVTGRSIKDLPLKNGLLLACINRKGQIIIPRGDDEIMVGDKIVVLTTNTGFHSVEDILR